MTSTTIYTHIIPTYLYIKQHSVTGLKYLGKTTRNPYKYLGSGKHWIRHYKKHGKEHIITLWVSEVFTDKSLLTEFSLFVSEEYNIVNSKEWANLKPENGLDGWTKGVKQKPESVQKRIDTINSDPRAKCKQYEKRAVTMSLKSKEEYDEMCSKISRPGILNPMFGKDRPDLSLNNKDHLLASKKGKGRAVYLLNIKLNRFNCNNIDELLTKISLELQNPVHYNKKGRYINSPNFESIAMIISPKFNPNDGNQLKRFYQTYKDNTASSIDNSSTLI